MIFPYIELQAMYTSLNVNMGMPTGANLGTLPLAQTQFSGGMLLQQKVDAFMCPSDGNVVLNQFYANPRGSSECRRPVLQEQLPLQPASDCYGRRRVQPAAAAALHEDRRNHRTARATCCCSASGRCGVFPVEKRSTGGVVWGLPTNNSDASTCFHPNHPINTNDPSNDFQANAYTQYASLARVPSNCNAHVATSNHPSGAQFSLCDGSVRFINQNIASNPIAYSNGGSGCTSTGDMNVTGRGFVYQNLYWMNDGNAVG